MVPLSSRSSLVQVVAYHLFRAKLHIELSNFNHFRKQIDGLVQERRNSIANALELRLSWNNPSKCRSYCSCLLCFISLPLGGKTFIYIYIYYPDHQVIEARTKWLSQHLHGTKKTVNSGQRWRMSESMNSFSGSSCNGSKPSQYVFQWWLLSAATSENKFNWIHIFHSRKWMTMISRYWMTEITNGFPKGKTMGRMTITQTPDIFSLADAAWKHHRYPCFCTLPLEFEVNIDIHKHENREVICSNRNKSPKEMPGNSRLQKHGKNINRFHLTKCTG